MFSFMQSLSIFVVLVLIHAVRACFRCSLSRHSPKLSLHDFHTGTGIGEFINFNRWVDLQYQEYSSTGNRALLPRRTSPNINLNGVLLGLTGKADELVMRDKIDNNNDESSDPELGHDEKEEEEQEDEELSDKVQKLMLSSIQWYKDTLSPLLPRRCRFLPTCSSYGFESIEKFGPWKGGLLTAWRILRCNPLGGSGYDPPQWPPPGYFAGSRTKFF
mmetsp:Transcript_5517/g.9037  ORF Transcript_5517/g.9037 Transcript_5517/m.9037 type:complete len:217 (+) Transcript_5517:11-661(+)